jgi:hypothetical protein
VSSPWAFGWTQLLTIVGFGITIAIALNGFRNFERWRRERIEERRIDIAFEALAFIYEVPYVVAALRAPVRYEAEWAEMPRVDGESEEDRRRRAAPYVISNRMKAYGDFFQRGFRLQPRFMAVFGQETEEIFDLLHMTIAQIRWAAWAKSMNGVVVVDAKERKRLEEAIDSLKGVILDGESDDDDDDDDDGDDDDDEKKEDGIDSRLERFRKKIEALCKPVVDREYQNADD